MTALVPSFYRVFDVSDGVRFRTISLVGLRKSRLLIELGAGNSLFTSTFCRRWSEFATRPANLQSPSKRSTIRVIRLEREFRVRKRTRRIATAGMV